MKEPMLTKGELRPNDALITHDTVIQASLLVEGKARLDEGYIIDLFSLIESAVLHNRLVTLYAAIPPHYSELGLRTALSKAKVIDDLDLVGSYGGTEKCVQHLGPKFEWISSKICPEVLTEAYASGQFHGLEDLWDPRATFNGTSTVEALSKEWYYMQASPFFKGYDYRQKLDALLGRYRGFFTFLLRTNLYWAVSAETFISQSMHSLRLPIISKIFDFLENSVSQRAYHILADAIKADLKDLRSWGNPTRLYIPPIVAVLLDRCRSPSDIPDELLKLRKEFSPYREKCTEYEQRIKNTQDLPLKEAIKAKAELNETMKLIIRDEFKDYSTRILREVPEFFDVTVSPDTMTSAGTVRPLKILAVGAQVLHDWWAKRRMVYLIDLKKKMYEIKQYDKLFEKAFGQGLTPNQVNNLNEISAAMEKMTFGKQGNF